MWERTASLEIGVNFRAQQLRVVGSESHRLTCVEVTRKPGEAYWASACGTLDLDTGRLPTW